MVDHAAERQALADKIRHDHAQTARRRRLVMVLVVVAGVVVSALVIAWLQLRPDTEAEADTSGVAVPDNSTDNYGFTLTPELASGSDDVAGTPIKVAIYEDFLCPSCKTFHDETGPFLTEQLTAGKISVTYQPFTFLLNSSTDEYAQRAANAAVCVGDSAGPVGYAAMHALLMKNQPAEGGAGLSDTTLIDYATQSGADDVTDCITDRTFDSWVAEALAAGQKAGITTTPTVTVDGHQVVRSIDGNETMPGPDEIEFALESVK